VCNFSVKNDFRYGQVLFGTDCSLYNKAMDSLITFLSHSALSNYLPVVNGVMEIFRVLITKQKWIKKLIWQEYGRNGSCVLLTQ
jgi:hypothetical protein